MGAAPVGSSGPGNRRAGGELRGRASGRVGGGEGSGDGLVFWVSPILCGVL